MVEETPRLLIRYLHFIELLAYCARRCAMVAQSTIGLEAVHGIADDRKSQQVSMVLGYPRAEREWNAQILCSIRNLEQPRQIPYGRFQRYAGFRRGLDKLVVHRICYFGSYGKME